MLSIPSKRAGIAGRLADYLKILPSMRGKPNSGILS
jgi:hypothetical protein